jgi:hypothetical protein
MVKEVSSSGTRDMRHFRRIGFDLAAGLLPLKQRVKVLAKGIY